MDSIIIVLGCIFTIGYLILNPSHDFQDVDE